MPQDDINYKIPLQLTAVATEVDLIINKEDLPMTIEAHGLSGVEIITVKSKLGDGSYQNIYDADSILVQLTETRNQIAVTSPMIIGFTKPSTSNPAGVAIKK